MLSNTARLILAAAQKDISDKSELTLLDRIRSSGSNLEFLVNAIQASGGSYIAELILNSEAILERSRNPWVYKSIAEYGEESFIKYGHVVEILDADTYRAGSNWQREAERALSADLCSTIVFASNDEGLCLYAEDDNGIFAQVDEEDKDYAYVTRLVEDQGSDALRLFSGAPTWAKRLHLYFPNWKAHNQLFRDCPNLSADIYDDWKETHKRAVFRETVFREMAVSPSQRPRGASEDPAESGAGVCLENLRSTVSQLKNELTTVRNRSVESTQDSITFRYKTSLLMLVAAVQDRYLGENFDPDDIDTRPRKEHVVEWLMRERNVSSRKVAEAIERVAMPFNRSK